jgi:hypothetical protein
MKSQEIIQWLREETPSAHLLAVVGNITSDVRIAKDLHEQDVASLIVQLKDYLDGQ